MKNRVLFAGVASVVLLAASAAFAGTSQLIVNGGFENGLTGWTVVNEAGSDGSWYVQSGTASPRGSFTVPTPPGGTYAAMTDSTGPSSTVLYQTITVPTCVTSRR